VPRSVNEPVTESKIPGRASSFGGLMDIKTEPSFHFDPTQNNKAQR
jgi:hypothetical protein